MLTGEPGDGVDATYAVAIVPFVPFVRRVAVELGTKASPSRNVGTAARRQGSGSSGLGNHQSFRYINAPDESRSQMGRKVRVREGG